MDSRIREIEQWVEEAKRGLEEGGREEYLRRLYLLDAEIRSVIRENVPLPEQVSRPGTAGRTSFHPGVAYAAAAVLLLVVSFVGFPALVPHTSQPADLAKDINLITADRGTADRRDLGFIPESIEGEEILGPDWQPAHEIEVPETPVFMAAGPFTGPGDIQPAALQALDLRTRSHSGLSTGGIQPRVYGNEAVGVVILAGSVDQARKGEQGPVATRFVRSDLFPDVAPSDRVARFTYFPEADKLKGEIDKPEKQAPPARETPAKVVQGAAVQVVVDNVDKKENKPVDGVDNP